MSVSLHPGRLLLRASIVLLVLLPLLPIVPGVWPRPAPAEPERAGPYEGGQPVLGFAIVAHHIEDLSLYLESIDRIAALDASALVVVTPWFQKRVDSTDIRRLPDRCPTDEQLVALLAHAERAGLATMLQPIVLLEDPGEDDWRGVLAPSSWEKWWTAYDRFIDHFTDLACRGGVDLLAIGSELNSTEDQLDRWRRIAARVRDRFDGRLTYSANWDRYDQVALWSLVDLMSVSAYFELVRHDRSAAEDPLVADWKRWQDDLLEAARSWELPLLLSEVGYPSLPWASAHPWNYVAPDGTAADHEAQARCYRAFFRAWGPAFADPGSPAMGFHCYAWDPYHHGQDDDTGYGVLGKPALEVIRQGFADIRRSASGDG